MIPNLGEIKMLRKKLNLTQQELSSRSGVSQSLIAKIESGKVDPTYTNASRIFDAIYSAEDKNSQISLQKAMQKKVISVTTDTKVAKAIEVMRKHGISQLPVIDEGKAVGLVSEGTILNALLEHKTGQVGEIMEDSPPIVSTNANQKIVLQLLRSYPLVLISEKGKIKGLLTKADMLANI